MSEKLRLTNRNPWSNTLSSKVRWAKINIWWKVLHALVWWGKSLSKTFQWFLDTTEINVDIDEASSKDISSFCENNSWVMILNHPNNNFADYIPLLA